MTYNPAIPQATDLISQSQAQIQTNFSQVDLIFDVDHVTFDNVSVASRGKHRKVDFIRIAAPGSLATEAVVYQKAASGNSELFMQRDNVGTEIQLTSGTPVVASNGSTFLPGLSTAVLGQRWGQFTFSGTSTTINYTTAFSASTFGVVITPINAAAAGTSYRVGTSSATGFTITTGSAVVNGSYFYIAIGN